MTILYLHIFDLDIFKVYTVVFFSLAKSVVVSKLEGVKCNFTSFFFFLVYYNHPILCV